MGEGEATAFPSDFSRKFWNVWMTSQCVFPNCPLEQIPGLVWLQTANFHWIINPHAATHISRASCERYLASIISSWIGDSYRFEIHFLPYVIQQKRKLSSSKNIVDVKGSLVLVFLSRPHLHKANLLSYVSLNLTDCCTFRHNNPYHNFKPVTYFRKLIVDLCEKGIPLDHYLSEDYFLYIDEIIQRFPSSQLLGMQI
uniref:Resistance disease protein n=1 Tax=Brassica oleracea TaxID=3712 RepID=Q944D8_BRAOL|nr:resistance disease protein [Brassica oleracea]